MIPLKEDGMIDVEKIESLPSSEYLLILEAMTQEQYQYYSDNSPENKGNNGPSKAIPVNYTLEEALEKRWIVDAQKHLKELREKYLKKMNNPRKVNEKYVRKAIKNIRNLLFLSK